MASQAFVAPDSRRGDQFRLGLGHPIPNMDLRRVHGSITPPYGSPTTDGGNVESSDENSAPSRKRIAVACGRCRKRKIRCSGDNGHGDPCTNCRNSGSTPCQFLRVQSHETNLKDSVNKNSPAFTYNIDISRQLQAGGPTDLLGAIVPSCQDLIQSWNPSVDGITFDKSGPTYPGDAAAAETNSKHYSWSSSGCCAVASNGLEVPYHSPAIMGAIYSQVQDPRYMASYAPSFAFRPITYFDTASSTYITSNQPTSVSTSAMLVNRQEIADLENQYGILGISTPIDHTAGHENKLGASSQSPGNSHLVKNETVSTVTPYSKPASSPAESLHSLTPSSSFDNSYTSSPVSAYSAMMQEAQAPQQRPLSRAAEMYTPSSSVGLVPTAPMSAAPVQASEFPPARTSSYVYRDTTAAAAAAAASGRRASPTAETYGVQQSYTSSTRVSEPERNIPGMRL